MVDKHNHFEQIHFLFRVLVRIISAAIGGVLFVFLVIALANLLLFVLGYLDVIERYRQFIFPRRALFAFVIGAYICWRRAPKIYDGLIDRFRNSQSFRLFILLSFFYVVCLLSYIQVFQPQPFMRGLEFLSEPYKYGKLGYRFEEFLKLLLYPISVFALGSYLLTLLKAPASKNDDAD